MIPFAAGLGVLACLALLRPQRAADLIAALPWLGVGLGLVGVGVASFRLPHRIQITSEEVRVAGRFGRPRRWQRVRLADAPAAPRVLAELSVGVAALGALLLQFGDPSVLQLPLLAAYAHGWWRWRREPRAVLEDDDGSCVTVRLGGLLAAAEAIAARAPRPTALVG